MNVKLPKFREGVEWRKLTKEERGDRPWKYKLLKNVFIEVDTGVRYHYDCCGGDGTAWMKILPHGITMLAGYAWNGNSFSPDKLFCRWRLLESLPHDGFFQFSGCMNFPRRDISLMWVNWLYYTMSAQPISRIYYAGLVAGSWALWCLPPKDGEYISIRPLFEEEPV